MRLINTSSFDIVEFAPGSVPPYAILSHRWDETELTLQDVKQSDRNLLPGFSKIQGCCSQARNDGLGWAWIDSCCIDKSSSAELSEAINSMFQWYRNSRVCYTYLSDVSNGVSDIQAGGPQFMASQWFTRGWTLQELLAPKYLRFFDTSWTLIGPRNDWQANDAILKLEKLIELATGIKHLSDYNNASVACKMSWAAGRYTTREEDRAYSLMGLFGVNMPLLYGEGPRAFHRLQLEILRETDDESIFAWADPQDLSGGLLAPSVNAFKNSGGVERLEHPLTLDGGQRSQSYERPPYSMTNKGIHFQGRPLELLEENENVDGETENGSSALVVLPIHCTDTSKGHGRLMCVWLGRVSTARKQWMRANSDILLSLNESQQASLLRENHQDWESFYVRQLGRYESPFQGPFKIVIFIAELKNQGYEYKHYAIHESSFMHDRYKLTQLPDAIQFDIESLLMSGLTMAIVFINEAGQTFFLVVNVMDFQISIELLGPFTYLGKTLPGRSRKNWAIFDDYFQQASWRTRSREASISWDSEGIELVAHLQRIWSEREQGYHISFIVKRH
ncbi:hypothetical protein GLAREA_01908 [Glarea lozoyensis ATCC 20868]|uniref:Uncharacterized protein n=1 Tax=Glarea lozoyensis (strain ATCC 20868 / MF5171) TaxID=1116229 RepID=S3D1S4_GLAL2|nr:uncharacterized protein GLAREA_01908 [Glarea lozoyensis ATCC 20868]EPE25996.1 hypothetical protein GLAREA_01908 [Glarea lozoyensis ATCC 20868]